MLCDVVDAKYSEDYKLEVLFENGKKGVVDFSNYPSRGGVFDRFKNIDFFKSFSVDKDLGTIVWGEEIDIAPETLYKNAR